MRKPRPPEEALVRTGKLLASASNMPGMRLTRALRDLRPPLSPQKRSHNFFEAYQMFKPRNRFGGAILPK